jgi:hypothetical protein
MTIKEAKSRMQVGQQLLCVKNTYRPALDGTIRTITAVGATVWTWRGPGDDRDSNSVWPSGIKVVDADTIRIPLFEQHYVELRFLETP